MSEQQLDRHPWCLDVRRDQAVRASEDGRSGPLPTLEEAIARIPKTGSGSSAVEPENKGNDMATNGLRTELVTLEVTHSVPVAEWDWTHILETYRPGESVRVVDTDITGEEIRLRVEADTLKARVAKLESQARSLKKAIQDIVFEVGRAMADRHAAIRERDELRADAERLRGKISAFDGQSRLDIEREIAVEEAWELCEIPQYWPYDEPGTSHRYAESMRQEIVRLRDRVAELESQLESVACRAATAETALEAAPAASGNVERRPMTMPSREWLEYMASVDDSEMSVGGLASRVADLESSAPAASVVLNVIRDMSEILRSNADQGEKHAALEAEIARLREERDSLLESQLWGVNCKPAPPSAVGTELPTE